MGSSDEPDRRQATTRINADLLCVPLLTNTVKVFIPGNIFNNIAFQLSVINSGLSWIT